ncbi:unnamed protein product [Mycena citricolor]|uniref:Gag protein n=1 Tax=Mycena citricolor TaxID=2018698 RepID=A0AAD2HF01_9AGAR|nr:unnamed protein product [Mycena citricolor]
MVDQDPNIVYSGEPGKDSISAEDFARHVALKMRTMALTTDADKLDAFGDFLLAGKPADKWWKAKQASTTPITKWTDARKEFVMEFDAPQAAEKTKQEWERELSKIRITLDKLGTKTMVGGVETHAHIAFARKMLRMAKEAGISKSNSNIWVVRDHLPISLRDQTPRSATSWEAFATAIEKIEVDKLREEVEKERENDKLKTELAALKARNAPSALVPQSPTAPLRTQMARTSISTEQRIPAPNFRPTMQTSPEVLSTEAKATLARVLEKMKATKPLLRTSPADVATYKARWRAFSALQEPVLVEQVGVPLSPGTVWPGSGECWNCGKLTAPKHNARECLETALPAAERRFRRICAKNMPRATSVNAVITDWMDEEDGGQQGFQDGSP